MTDGGLTYREKRERKAERLREWAEKRQAKAEAASDRAHQIADMIPMGQPILVGHHSERHARRDQERIHNGMRQAIDNQEKAVEMARRADNIEAAARAAIYSDDPDAIERLQEKISGLEEERDRLKAYNKTCRAGKPDLTILTEREQESLKMIARVASYQLGKNCAMPSYAITNLSGNISRLKKRLAQLEAQRGTASVQD